jgi:hypothetical protein
VLILARDLNLRVIAEEDGQLIRELVLDPTGDSPHPATTNPKPARREL